MDLLALGTDFQADTYVEGWKSLIWAERYRKAGDFTLKTNDVEKTMAQLPLSSMVGLGGSRECQIVESHIVEKDPDGDYELTVSGRSFESFLENRVANEDGVRMFTINGDDNFKSETDAARKTRNPYNYDLNNEAKADTGDAASKYIEEIFNFKIKRAADVNHIPNVTMTIDTSARMPAKPRRWLDIKLGTVYDRMQELMAMDDLGVKTLLPLPGATGTPILTINIFAGLDRSDTVVFSVSAGHFEKVSYGWALQGTKNSVISFAEWDFLETLTSSGINRRIGFLEAMEVQPKKTPSVGARVLKEPLTGKNKAYLTENKLKTVFEGEVSTQLPYKIGTDYNIGDIVKVVADFKVNQKMRVSEYIRIQDAEGERAYPTLEEP